MPTTLYQLRESLVDLPTYQFQKLNELIVFVSHFNKFYKDKLNAVNLPLRTLEDLHKIPFTTKQELALDQLHNFPFGSNHSYPESSYIRYHQTSGTSGRPLKVLDTVESWDWWQDCWLEVLKSAELNHDDRLFLAFSFGPFIGFWSAYEAAKKAGALVITGGGQSSEERLASIIENKVSVILCTPSYALHLPEVAAKKNVDIIGSSVRLLVLAGEPGGSIPSVRQQIETLWGAKVFDHVGMTEMGAYGYSCKEQTGIHINEAQFIAEIINPETLKPVNTGERGELVLTNLGRYGFPLIRYRTGDAVINLGQTCSCGSDFKLLPGGIIGRVDDMVIVRGINIFPQSIEAIVREFPEVVEFSIVFYTVEEMNQVKVKIESDTDILQKLRSLLRERLGLRIEVELVENGSLPRFEMKARRVQDLRLRKIS
ncbi:MAG: phenylacetate--CoA ligase [Desulfosporosinus sp. BRH_c37]|nr:MAG: phenylacetate--CoA ligase [Desulfosporosinus sp. BRH_c37]